VRSLENIRGFASIPLVTKDTVLGVLNIIRRTPYTFSSEEQSMLRAFGNQIGVALDNAKLYEAARAGEQQIRRLSIDLVRIQEEERKRFARELHDGLAQLLMTLRVNAELALKNLGATGGQVEQHLHEIVSLVGEAESEAKQISYDLRPAILDDFGLTAALQVLAKMFFRRTGVAVDLHVPDSDLRFDSVIETTVYRIVQELLANVAKHAHATSVTIQLLVRNNLIALTVADNGKGFNMNEGFALHDGESHNGLRNMRERAESLRGMFRVESVPGRGAEFAIEIPCSLDAIDVEQPGEVLV
jgi:signal transduction histidine kinase